MFYGHIYTTATVHLIKDCHFARSGVTSFLRNIVEDASVAVRVNNLWGNHSEVKFRPEVVLDK